MCVCVRVRKKHANKSVLNGGEYDIVSDYDRDYDVSDDHYVSHLVKQPFPKKVSQDQKEIIIVLTTPQNGRPVWSASLSHSTLRH